MATCKNCKRSGLFFSVNKYGVCNTCYSAIIFETQSRFRVIDGSMKIVSDSKKTDTRLSRCDLIIVHAKELMKFEKMGIPTTQPQPSIIVRTYEDNKLKLIKEDVTESTRLALEKARLATTATSKVSHLSKVVLKVVDYRRIYPNESDLMTAEAKLRKVIQEIQLSSYLNDAKKAEFKGDKKKALDKYYEALYFLQHDEIDDALQTNEIEDIEAKIKELS